MTLIWTVRICILMILQMITSMVLIYHGKKKISYFTEVLLSCLSIVYVGYGIPKLKENSDFANRIYNNESFSLDKIFLYIMAYIVLKILLILIVWFIRYFSFYALVSISKKNGRIANIGYMIFGKKNFIRFVSNMWNKVHYGITISKGIPGMVNKRHKVTGIYFDNDGFPKFKVITQVKLSRNLWRKDRETHFRNANKMLYEQIKKNKRLAQKFTKGEIKQFSTMITPAKYTWHHHQKRGVLQLVEYDVHKKVNHRGGFSIWGKKE